MVGFCSEQSRSAGEELRASAATDVREWLLVETREAWGARPPVGCGFDPRVESYLARAGEKGSGRRLQLIRRARAAGEKLRLYRARDGGLWTVELEAKELVAWCEADGFGLQGPGDSAWSRVEDDLYIVCTHGKRDACCAKQGLPVFEALAKLRPGQVWQTTHLGGHRFAPTLAHLPSGLCYGRVGLDALGSLVEGLERGLLPRADLLRGDCALSRVEQVSAHAVLAELARRGDVFRAGLVCLGTHEGRQVWTYADSERDPMHFSVTCEAAASLELLGSCSDDRPTRMAQWSVASIERI
jgi:hypothetical protein